MYQEGIQARTEKITSIYKTIHLILIRYGIFFLAIILGGYISRLIIQKETTILSINTNTKAEKEYNIKKFKTGIERIQNTKDFTIFVGLGAFERKDPYILSYNNLIAYNGYTLPRFFEGSIDLFTNTGINNGEIDSKESFQLFIENFLSIKNKNTLIKSHDIGLTIKNNLITTFNLDCLSQTKIYDGLCNIFTDNFINTFLLYDISEDIEGFKDVFTKIINKDRTKYQTAICQNLIYYSYYSKNTSAELKSIMRMCPVEEYGTFNKFALYVEVEKELENKSISNLIYADTVINEYKIRSFIQILYEDVNNKQINAARINNYFNFLESILKQDKISKLDANLIYYFNNYHLKGALENPELFIKSNNREVYNLLKRINNINNGNSLIGYKGLEKMVNKNLYVQKDDEEKIEEKIEEKASNTILPQLLSEISNFKIEEQQIWENQGLVKGVLNIISADKKEIAIGIRIRFEEKSSVLFIKKIEVNNEDEFNQNINTILTKIEWTFGDLQKYISENTNLLNIQTDKTTSKEEKKKAFCEMVVEKTNDFAYIEKCTNNSLKANFTQGVKNISIVLNYENYVFKNVEVSDEVSKTKISNYLNKAETITKYRQINEINMIEFLVDLITIVKDTSTPNKEEFDASENTLIIIDNIKKYLGVTIEDIVEKENRIAITFTLGDIKLLANYNIKTHTLDQVYFRDILGTNGVPSLIKNTKILLDESNIEELKKLRNNPLEYFKAQNSENYLLYIKSKG